MTTDTTKDSIHCLICNSKVGVSTRNSVRIFGDVAANLSDKPLLSTIRTVLDKDIEEDAVRSAVVCKKCYKLFSEFDELEGRLAEIKFEIRTNYEKTIKKITPEIRIQEEYTDHDYIDNFDSRTDRSMDLTYENKKIEPLSSIKKAQSEENITERYLMHKIDKEEDKSSDYIEDHEDSTVKIKDIADLLKSQTKKLKNDIEIEDPQEKIVMRDGMNYTCLLCTNEDERVVGDAKEIISHVKEIHESRLYICDICGMDFRKRTEMSVHLDDHVAKEEGDFQCEVCNRIFSNLRLFRIHKRIHYPQVKSWPCETCGKKYSSKNLLEEHTNTHTGLRPYICEVCSKDFASKYTYKAHVKTHEIRARPFECGQCGKSFLSQQNLNQHERTHNGVKEYVCHQCGKAFGSHHNLEVHNIVHTGYKPYICRQCGKAFARKAEIRDHERTHTGEKPYQCEFCGATFSQRSNLQSHKRATHYNDKRYKCDDCGKGFKRRRLLDYHIKAAHTGERPYKCEICTATFVYPEHFKKHMRIHTGEKPYLCEVCGKAFNSRDNRNAHRFIHSDKKPYECLVCGMGFMRKPLLYSHMQTQGHLNDTIVVNQPRLTTEDDQAINVTDGGVELLMNDTENEQLEETELYVADLKDHIIIQQTKESIYEDDKSLIMVADESVEQKDLDAHLIVNRQASFTDTGIVEKKENNDEQIKEAYTYQAGEEEEEEEETIVVPVASDYKEIVGDSKNNSVRLVEIRIPSSSGGDARSWISLVQNNS